MESQVGFDVVGGEEDLPLTVQDDEEPVQRLGNKFSRIKN